MRISLGVLVVLLFGGCVTAPPIQTNASDVNAVKALRENPPQAGFANLEITCADDSFREFCSWRNNPICLNDTPVAKVGTGGVIFAVVPVGEITRLTYSNEPLFPSCNARNLLNPQYYSGYVRRIDLNVIDSGHYIWKFTWDSHRATALAAKPVETASGTFLQPNLKRVLTGVYIHPSYNTRVSTSRKEPTNQTETTNIETHKKQCESLGFSPGTEKFGNCVLTLMENN